MNRALAVLLGSLTVVLLLTSAMPAASTLNDHSRRLRRAVSVEGILEHQRALQEIADLGGDNRLAGAPGDGGSADYIAKRVEAAGHDVQVQEFEYDLRLIADWQAPVLAIEGGTAFVPGIAGGRFGGDFGSMFKSAPYGADVTAPVWAIDLVLPPGDAADTSASGCEASDYANVPEGAIILVQRGTCTFERKFALADESGAGAMVFFNEGQPNRTTPLWLNVDGLEIPTFAATVETATALSNGVRSGDTGLTARFRIDWRPGTYTTRNVIAETRAGDADNVVVVGAHLDSVGVGAGIQDNGSGSATILEIAEQMSEVEVRNKVRFIWFGAEESGLLGSGAYVAGLSERERADIAAMLNFDMIASPNFVRFVYDGDLSDSEPPAGGAPDGSTQIERLFVNYFARQGLATAPTPFDGRSDYGPFIAVGIPAGGLFTGAEGIKTPQQAAIYGGVAGQQYDPCYHLGCDDIDNLNLTALDQMSDAAAHATIALAQRTRAIGGRRAERTLQPARPRSGSPPEFAPGR